MDIVVEQWRGSVRARETKLVLPDGCLDLIVVREAGKAPSVRLTERMERPRWVPVPASSTWLGFRLHPALRVPESALPQLEGLVEDTERLEDALENGVRGSAALADALEALRGAASVGAAAAESGVSLRTLQRLVGRESGWPADRWRRLGRARAAARVITASQRPLAEVAVTHGFADQPHLTRELKRWLAATPGALRRGGPAAERVQEPGYEADETTEQISTSTPSGSAT